MQITQSLKYTNIFWQLCQLTFFVLVNNYHKQFSLLISIHNLLFDTLFKMKHPRSLARDVWFTWFFRYSFWMFYRISICWYSLLLFKQSPHLYKKIKKSCWNYHKKKWCHYCLFFFPFFFLILSVSANSSWL